MKSPLVRILAFALILSACTPAPPPPVTTEVAATAATAPTGDGADLSIFKDGLRPTSREALSSLVGASIYRIDYTIDESLTSLQGQERVHYTNREEIALSEIDVRLLPNVLNGAMQVLNVTVDDTIVDETYDLQDSLLRIPLDTLLAPGESLDLGFEFSVYVPTELESNYGILAYYDGVLTLAHGYPMIAVYDDEGWNAEIPPDQGDPTYADASFFLVRVDAPANLVLVASGYEVSREEHGDRQLVAFAAGPARDFYLAASPDYVVVSKNLDGVTFNSYASGQEKEAARVALDDAVAAFEVFEQRYAPYPYTEFDIIATPTYALGVEYPGVIAITNRLYDLSGSLSGMPNRNLMESVVVHEAGHQWFYNLVGNDQLDEPWLDESLVQFATWQYYLDRYGASGASGFEASLRARWARVDDQPIPIGLPVAEYTGSAYSAIVYGRGAFFFEALRERLGEEHFDAFMQDYTQTNAWGIATGESLKALAEEYCDCDLSDLYEEWVLP